MNGSPRGGGASDRGGGDRGGGGSRNPAPGPDALRRARNYWEQSGEDCKDAGQRLQHRNWLDASYLHYQSAVNALICVCHLHGKFRVPANSAVQLAASCAGEEPRFAGLREACGELEEVLQRGPYDAGRDPLEEERLANRCQAHAGIVRDTVRGYLKDNRKRYFKP